MKVFESAKWDPDAENNISQELFKTKNKTKLKAVNNMKSLKKKIQSKIKNKVLKNVGKHKVMNFDHVSLVNASLPRKVSAKSKKKKHEKSKDLTDTMKQEKKSKTILGNNLQKKVTEDITRNKAGKITNTIKNNKQKLKKLQKNVKTLNKINLKSDDLVNLVDTPTKKKKLKTLQESNSSLDISNNTQSNTIKQRPKKNKKNQKEKMLHVNNSMRNNTKTKNLQNKSKTTNKSNNHQDNSAEVQEKFGITNPKVLQKDQLKKKMKYKQSTTFENSVSKTHGSIENKNIQKLAKLKEAVLASDNKKLKRPVPTLRQKMMERLKAARFRFINEQIYTADSKEAQELFQNDPQAFNAYHDGYRKQVKRWPLNPLDTIINTIKKLPRTHVVADFGCGDARLSKSINQKVHSFDLVAVDEAVVACDMANVPLENNSVDVAVYCLSLMGTNLRDYLAEANRVLKVGGVLKIAEVESRFENIEDFIKGVSYFGFKNTWKDQSHNLFYFLDFKKERDVKHKNKLPTLSLLPCLYKKR
ncbi:uncharacterized protein LOC126886897 [Diabrotica virgifera virgifera]|uniref:Ribosomal RNA-processing protein 8 n=1 Tax=Diabrotica virgifera virgifera TaxID=50390 RepID=A0ABM5KIR6_DIAVI|nr:uncharacterized protein LOC126886897 [Diabrotica virgifera virgifera]